MGSHSPGSSMGGPRGPVAPPGSWAPQAPGAPETQRARSARNVSSIYIYTYMRMTVRDRNVQTLSAKFFINLQHAGKVLLHESLSSLNSWYGVFANAHPMLRCIAAWRTSQRPYCGVGVSSL